MMRPPLILAYHCLGQIPREQDRHNLVISTERFRSQVERLLARDYTFVTVSEFARRLHAHTPLSGVCALTFDDGSVDNAEILPKLLTSLGVPATLFVCHDLLGQPHPFMDPAAGVRLMTDAELRAVADLSFIEVGAHTDGHTDLSSATSDQAYEAMASSKQSLENLLNKPVTSFAYPFCSYSPACPDAAKRTGYTSAVTCGPRGGWQPFELRRESINSLDGRLSFALKSRGVFYALWSSPPGRLARRAARPFRHRSAASPS